MSPHNLSSKVWNQWSRLVVNRDTPKKLKYTTSDLAPPNIKLVSSKDTDNTSWFEPWDKLDKLTLTEPKSLNKLPTLDLEADEKLDIAIFRFDCPDKDSILASELSALVQIIGIRSRQSTFSGTPNIATLLISLFGARQVRVIQGFYSNENWKDEGGEPKLTVTLEKAIDLAGEDRNEKEERMDEIIR
ncbi:unnamed protein product [Penicillium viridicatum]